MPGKKLISNGSGLLLGPLGQCKVGFKGWDLGKTTEETILSKEEDRLDVMYQQEGSKPSDHVSTGTNYLLSATFGEISTQLLKQLIYSFDSKASEDGTGDDSGTFGVKQFCSLRDSEAGALRINPLDCDGDELTDLEDTLNFYEVLALVDENIINWSVDTQRNIPVTFYIYLKTFGDDQVVSGPAKAFGYYGDPAVELVPASDWPDLEGPQITSAIASAATQIDLIFNENVALVGGSYTSGIIVKVNDDWIAPTGVVVSTTTSTITLPASSIAAGDTVEISISDNVYEDTETTPNVMEEVNNKIVTNSV